MKNFPQGLHLNDSKSATKDKPIREIADPLLLSFPRLSLPVATVNLDSLSLFSPESIRQIIHAAGIVGMGGAGFPTHVKVAIPKEKKVAKLIINGCECEPYITADYRLMVERPDKIVFGAKLLAKAAGATEIIFGIEDNKREAIKAIKAAIREHPAESPLDIIDVIIFPTKYPQGSEKQLIQSIIGKEVPAGGLPCDVGVIVFNVATANAVADAALEGLSLVKRVVTVTGSGIKEPQNLMLKIGTKISDAINLCGGMTADAGKVIIGGPMMGVAIDDLSQTVEKTTTCILVLNKKEAKEYVEIACIRCGRCIKACPTGLMPNFMKDDAIDVIDCIECGCCAYVCPSRISLVQYFKKAKKRLKNVKR
ncbi:MAG: electron transport complex subunit RsxC [Candidatus Margulisiibacteriota bacterium]